METREKQLISALYEEMYRKLLFYAQQILHDRFLAEEAVQETFRIACTKVKVLESSPNPQGWLFLTLQNAIRNMRRNQNKLAQMLIYVSAVDGLNQFVDGQADNENPDILYNDMCGSDDYELIKKFAVNKQPIAEIADELGISPNACKQRIFRAKRSLRRRIEEYQIKENKQDKNL